MRVPLSTLWFLLFSSWAPLGHPSQLDPVEPPREAPALSLPDTKGENHHLVEYRGKVVLVNFWTTWCAPCLVEMPGLQRLARRLSAAPFALLTVNVGESKAKVFRFRRLTGFRENVLLDLEGETFAAWEASVYPTSFLVDKRGRVRYRVVGALDWDGAEAAEVIEALLAEGGVEIAPGPRAAGLGILRELTE
jgi:thiol-disulfide isomerase/thioredoxin